MSDQNAFRGKAFEAILDRLTYSPLPAPVGGDSSIPHVTHEGRLEIPGLPSIRVCVLSDGRRIIPAEDMAKLLPGLMGDEA